MLGNAIVSCFDELPIYIILSLHKDLTPNRKSLYFCVADQRTAFDTVGTACTLFASSIPKTGMRLAIHAQS